MNDSIKPVTKRKELDVCPHCGGKARIVGDLGGYRACCDLCFAQTGLATTPEEALERWNRRTPPFARYANN